MITEFYNPPALAFPFPVAWPAQEPANMQAGLRRLIAGALSVDVNATVCGFDLQGSTDGKNYVGLVHFGSDATPETATEIPAAFAMVSCIASVAVDSALLAAWRRLNALIAAEASGAGGIAVFYSVKQTISGAGGQVMIGVLWRLLTGG